MNKSYVLSKEIINDIKSFLIPKVSILCILQYTEYNIRYDIQQTIYQYTKFCQTEISQKIIVIKN